MSWILSSTKSFRLMWNVWNLSTQCCCCLTHTAMFWYFGITGNLAWFQNLCSDTVCPRYTFFTECCFENIFIQILWAHVYWINLYLTLWNTNSSLVVVLMASWTMNPMHFITGLGHVAIISISLAMGEHKIGKYPKITSRGIINQHKSSQIKACMSNYTQ